MELYWRLQQEGDANRRAALEQQLQAAQDRASELQTDYQEQQENLRQLEARLTHHISEVESLQPGTTLYAQRQEFYRRPRAFRDTRDRRQVFNVGGFVRQSNANPLLEFATGAMPGVMACQNCGQIWSRDCNAALNITLKSLLILNRRDLPVFWGGVGDNYSGDDDDDNNGNAGRRQGG